LWSPCSGQSRRVALVLSFASRVGLVLPDTAQDSKIDDHLGLMGVLAQGDEYGGNVVSFLKIFLLCILTCGVGIIHAKRFLLHISGNSETNGGFKRLYAF
jgi:hypothetical protein